MQYIGSKRRIAKELAAVMLLEAKLKGLTTWVEPFVGGGNMIEVIPSSFTRIGIDINPHTIAALTAIRDFPDKLPYRVSEAEYAAHLKKPASPISSWIRFAASFGAKFEGGYGRAVLKGTEADTENLRSLVIEGRNAALIQSPLLQGVELYVGSYADYSHLKNCIIYCDPPYQGTTKYKTDTFSHYLFWNWVRKMSKDNSVFVSEYTAPQDFTAIYEIEIQTSLNSKRTSATAATEKLFMYKP